jgi:L-alanine-DL-glutamate epimerase-like enolase superfamily enzyme
LRDESGRAAFGEGHISPGSSRETREGGWAFCLEWSARMAGTGCADAAGPIEAAMDESPVAASALLTAMEMLAGHPLLEVESEVRLPLVTPTHGLGAAEIEAEVEARLAEGFRTFKVKVGKDAAADLERVRLIQRVVNDRATLRLDANRAYTREDGCRFAVGLNPDRIELFEQPCAAEDWEANAAVARVSPVPLMLDEAICSLADIERAGETDGVAFCKLKLKRFGSLGRLETALCRVRDLGMEPVLGDGLSSEPGCWMEACVARSTIRNAGEFNGFLKPRTRLFETPLEFEDGAVLLRPGGPPRLDGARLDAVTVDSVRREVD